MRLKEYAEVMNEDVFPAADKKELGRRRRIEVARMKKAEEERKRTELARLTELLKIPVVFKKSDEGPASGSKTVTFFGKKISCSFTCEIEGGSMQTMEDPGEPAYPVLLTISDVEDEDGNPFPITEALVEVVGDSITIDDVDTDGWDQDYWDGEDRC